MNDSTQWTLPPARQEDYEGRDRHWNLRKMMLAAAKDCDLFCRSERLRPVRNAFLFLLLLYGTVL